MKWERKVSISAWTSSVNGQRSSSQQPFSITCVEQRNKSKVWLLFKTQNYVVAQDCTNTLVRHFQRVVVFHHKIQRYVFLDAYCRSCCLQISDVINKVILAVIKIVSNRKNIYLLKSISSNTWVQSNFTKTNRCWKKRLQAKWVEEKD